LGFGIKPPNGFEFRGGCTLIFDLNTVQLKYAISKPLVDLNNWSSEIRQIDVARAEQQYNYQNNQSLAIMSEFHQYFGVNPTTSPNEPFALLHHA